MPVGFAHFRGPDASGKQDEDTEFLDLAVRHQLSGPEQASVPQRVLDDAGMAALYFRIWHNI